MNLKHEDYKQCEENSVQNYCICKSCNSYFVFNPDDAKWDEQGYGYSTKLVKCKECGRINVIKYIEDNGLNVNNDMRFYNYKR
jgi:RNase P subunit RPR2